MKQNRIDKYYTLPWEFVVQDISDVPKNQFVTFWPEKFWRTTDQGLLFRGNSPLCYSSRFIMEQLTEGTEEPWWEISWIELACATVIMSERFKDNEYMGLDWNYQELEEFNRGN